MLLLVGEAERKSTVCHRAASSLLDRRAPANGGPLPSWTTEIKGGRRGSPDADTVPAVADDRNRRRRQRGTRLRDCSCGKGAAVSAYVMTVGRSRSRACPARLCEHECWCRPARSDAPLVASNENEPDDAASPAGNGHPRSPATRGGGRLEARIRASPPLLDWRARSSTPWAIVTSRLGLERSWSSAQDD